MMQEVLYIIKIGGNVIDDDESLKHFLRDFASIRGKKILVHGGGKMATSLGNELGISSKYFEGRRITDEEALRVVTMVYGGLINKKIVALLQAEDCNALGITGADANLIPAHKRVVNEIDYGWVGDIEIDSLEPKKWKGLLDQKLVPVVAPLTHDGKGNMLNTNADTIAATLAAALAVEYKITLVYCFEKKGVLRDVNDSDSLINKLTIQKYHQLKEGGKLVAGILPKIDNALMAVEHDAYQVIIGHSTQLLALIHGKEGTLITK